MPHDYGVDLCPVTSLPVVAKRDSSAPEAKPARRAPFVDAKAEALAASRGSLVGRVIGGKYGVLGVIGEGGMGIVYEAEHLTIGSTVAIKVLHTRYAGRRDAAERFYYEARVVGSVGHPGICEVFDVGKLEDGSPYLVMERLRGETLAARLRREGKLGWPVVRAVLSEVLSVLVVAHQKGVVHRDLKPDNIFLTTRVGQPPLVKLLDFGISKVVGLDDDSIERTKTGLVMGTPYYMAPEQARGDQELDGRVDLWALGVVSYELITGSRPFVAKNCNALLMKVLSATPKPMDRYGTGISQAAVDFVARAMAKDREARFGSALEMLEALGDLEDRVAIGGLDSAPALVTEDAEVTIREVDWDGGTTRRQAAR